MRVGTRYYPAGAVADPDDHLDIIRAYLQEHGIGRRQDFIRLLGLEPEQGTLLLRRLTDRGELVLTGGITPCRSRRNDPRFAPKTPETGQGPPWPVCYVQTLREWHSSA